MFKHAYVRGIQVALVNSGHAAFPDETTATKVADYIADHVAFDPTNVSRETTHKIATDLITASDHLKRQPGFKAASFSKVASWEDVDRLADFHAVQVMEKAAEGSTIEGGDKGNAAASSAEGKMDEAQRPAGYAENSLGKTEVDTRPGSVGKEQPQPVQPSESPSGSNSVTEHSRTASLNDLFRKAAEGSTILGGDKGNDAAWSAEGKMDEAQRPAGYAVLPSQGAPGALPGMATGSAIIGKEVAHPNGPAESPSGTNSVTAHSAKAASEDPFITLFKKVAAEVAAHIPAHLPENDKIAHVRACMGMTANEKIAYLAKLAADEESEKKDEKSDDDKKEESNLPPWLAGKIDEKKDEKSDEKKDDEKKEASFRAHATRIAQALRVAK